MPAELAITARPPAQHPNHLGRYELVAPLGQGGMGTIYLAVTTGPADFRKLLVVKELRQDLSANHRFVEMFLDEAKLAARLNHPNVVQTIEAGQEGERYFLSMEFLDGQPYSAIWQNAQLALPLRLKILTDALAGLHYAHTLTEYDGTSLQIVHRDVSPQNIFVTYDGQVKVVDFGIAKAAVSGQFSAPGVFKGKFGYAAPEQVRGTAVDARTDVFAMGVILWETLTMRRFSDGVVNRESVARRLGGSEPRASKLQLELDPRLLQICDRALAVDPDDRFESAEALRVALDDYLARSGQRVETHALKQALERRFAAERQAVHRLIDRHIKSRGAETSHVSTVALNGESGNNQPTQVADLSRFVQDTSTQTVVSRISLPLSAAHPPRTRRALGMASALGLLAVGLGYASLHGRGTAPAPPARSAPQPTAANAALAPVNPPPSAAVEVQPAATAATPEARPSLPDVPVPAVPDGAERGAVRAKLGGRRATHAHPAAPVLPEVSAPPPAPSVAAAQPAEVVAKPAMGGDLNRLEKSYQRRSIDTDL